MGADAALSAAGRGPVTRSPRDEGRLASGAGSPTASPGEGALCRAAASGPDGGAPLRQPRGLPCLGCGVGVRGSGAGRDRGCGLAVPAATLVDASRPLPWPPPEHTALRRAGLRGGWAAGGKALGPPAGAGGRGPGPPRSPARRSVSCLQGDMRSGVQLPLLSPPLRAFLSESPSCSVAVSLSADHGPRADVRTKAAGRGPMGPGRPAGSGGSDRAAGARRGQRPPHVRRRGAGGALGLGACGFSPGGPCVLGPWAWAAVLTREETDARRRSRAGPQASLRGPQAGRGAGAGL